MVCLSTVYRYFQTGLIKALKIRNKTFVRYSDIERVFDDATSYRKRRYQRKEEQEYYTLGSRGWMGSTVPPEAALQVIDSIVLSHFQPFIFHVLYACVFTVVENPAQGCTAVGQLFDAVGGQLQVGFSAVEYASGRDAPVDSLVRQDAEDEVGVVASGGIDLCRFGHTHQQVGPPHVGFLHGDVVVAFGSEQHDAGAVAPRCILRYILHIFCLSLKHSFNVAT